MLGFLRTKKSAFRHMRLQWDDSFQRMFFVESRWFLDKWKVRNRSRWRKCLTFFKHDFNAKECIFDYDRIFRLKCKRDSFPCFLRIWGIELAVSYISSCRKRIHMFTTSCPFLTLSCQTNRMKIRIIALGFWCIMQLEISRYHSNSYI